MKFVKFGIIILLILPYSAWSVLSSTSEVAQVQKQLRSSQTLPLQLRLLYSILNRNLESIESLLVKLDHLNYELPVSGSFETSFGLSFDLCECVLTPVQAVIRISDNNILSLVLSCQKTNLNFIYPHEPIYWACLDFLLPNPVGRGGDTVLTLCIKCFLSYKIYLKTPAQLTEKDERVVSEHKHLLRLLLVAGASVNQPNVFGYAALHLAVLPGCGWMIEELLRSKADLNQVVSRGYPSLFIPEAQTSRAPFFYDVRKDTHPLSGLDITFQDSHFSPLDLMLQHGSDILWLKLLLNAKANPNLTPVGHALSVWYHSRKTAKNGWLAGSYDHQEALELLLMHKADPSIPLPTGRTLSDEILAEADVSQSIKDLIVKYDPSAQGGFAPPGVLNGQKRRRDSFCQVCYLKEMDLDKALELICSSCGLEVSFHLECYERLNKLLSGKVVCPQCRSALGALVCSQSAVQEGRPASGDQSVERDSAGAVQEEG